MNRPEDRPLSLSLLGFRLGGKEFDLEVRKMSSLENGRARELAELASVEQDPHKLIALVTELNFLLENEQKYSEATWLPRESEGL